jgi:hypothetical protein
VVEFDPDGATVVVRGHGAVKLSVVEAEFLERPEGGSCRPAEFRMVPLGLELVEHHLVAAEPAEGQRIR